MTTHELFKLEHELEKLAQPTTGSILSEEPPSSFPNTNPINIYRKHFRCFFL